MRQISLDKHDIHLWMTRPKSINEQALLARFSRMMSNEERQRQQRFKFAHLRHDALITRALVRTALSHYAPIEPEQWQFVSGSHGKPSIADPGIKLKFNISHTEDFIICAVTPCFDIGVDVEWLERQSDTLSIADRFFSPDEVSELFSLPEDARHSRFFDYWTLKESYIKACGLGLAIPLDHFSFIIGPHPANPAINNNIQLRFSPQREDSPENWQSWLFYPCEHYRVALSIQANQSTAFRLRYFSAVPLLDAEEKPSLQC